MTKIKAQIHGAVWQWVFDIRGNKFPALTNQKQRALDGTAHNLRMLSERYPEIKFEVEE